MNEEDENGRRERFEAAHPEWALLPPTDLRAVLRGESEWRALGPGDQFARAHELSDLLDQLEKLVTE